MTPLEIEPQSPVLIASTLSFIGYRLGGAQSIH